MNLAVARMRWTVVFCFLLAMASLPARADGSLGQRISWPAVQLVDGSRLGASALDGRVVLVVFWATWCPLCRTELPELQRFLTAQRGAAIEVLAISLDEAPAEVRDYVRRNRFGFRFAMQTAALGERFGPVTAIPLTLIFDRQGVLRSRHLGAVDGRTLSREIAPLLEKGVMRTVSVAPR